MQDTGVVSEVIRVGIAVAASIVLAGQSHAYYPRVVPDPIRQDHHDMVVVYGTISYTEDFRIVDKDESTVRFSLIDQSIKMVVRDVENLAHMPGNQIEYPSFDKMHNEIYGGYDPETHVHEQYHITVYISQNLTYVQMLPVQDPPYRPSELDGYVGPFTNTVFYFGPPASVMNLIFAGTADEYLDDSRESGQDGFLPADHSSWSDAIVGGFTTVVVLADDINSGYIPNFQLDDPNLRLESISEGLLESLHPEPDPAPQPQPEPEPPQPDPDPVPQPEPEPQPEPAPPLPNSADAILACFAAVDTLKLELTSGSLGRSNLQKARDLADSAAEADQACHTMVLAIHASNPSMDIPPPPNLPGSSGPSSTNQATAICALNSINLIMEAASGAKGRTNLQRAIRISNKATLANLACSNMLEAVYAAEQ